MEQLESARTVRAGDAAASEPASGEPVPGSRIPREPGDSADPLGKAAAELFGLPSLFPYQRLVISNILEASRPGKRSRRTRRPGTGRLWGTRS